MCQSLTPHSHTLSDFYFILSRDTDKDEDEVPETDRKHYFHIVGNSQLYISSHALQEHSRVPDTFASNKTLFPFGESGNVQRERHILRYVFLFQITDATTVIVLIVKKMSMHARRGDCNEMCMVR